MNWFGGVMNGNNTAFEFQTEFASAGTSQSLQKGSDSGASGDHIYIDWGDGSAIERFSDVESESGGYATHTYAGTGPYRIRIWQQDFDRNNLDNDIAFNSFYTNTDWKGIPDNGKSKIISFGLIMHMCQANSGGQFARGLAFGWRRNTIGWDMAYLQNYPIISSTSDRNLQRFFQGTNDDDPAIWKDPYGNNKKLYWFDNPDFSPGVFSLSFFNQTNFNCYVGGWDMSNTTNIASMFRATAFNNDGVDDLNDWDTSNVTSFSQVFRSCPFNHDLSSWSFASQTSLQRMFQSNGSFDQDISAWGTNDGGMAASTATFNNMLDSTAMSTENYSKWIICLANWAYDNSYTQVETLGGSGLSYNSTTYSGIGSGQYTNAAASVTYLESLGWAIGGTLV